MHHLDRLTPWLNGQDIYPIYLEVSPSGTCNHRCIFCALDYMEYQPVFLETEKVKEFLAEAKEKGLKSVMFSGEGEPLLHKDIAQIITSAKKSGLDTAVTSNGVLFEPELARKILPFLDWFRISFNAGDQKTYALVHQTKSQDFNKVLSNIERAVKIKKENNYDCTIGAQMLLLNENFDQAPKLAQALKERGADYLIIKPYSQHLKSKNKLGGTIDYEKYSQKAKRLEKYNSDQFQVIFRKHTMDKLNYKKPYDKCLGLPFWAYLSSLGDLYACSAFLGDERFNYGNIYKQSFEDLWKSDKRKQINQMMASSWDIDSCREVCRFDEINIYLWDLKCKGVLSDEPVGPIPEHINFI